jgi:hypothetical protein
MPKDHVLGVRGRARRAEQERDRLEPARSCGVGGVGFGDEGNPVRGGQVGGVPVSNKPRAQAREEAEPELVAVPVGGAVQVIGGGCPDPDHRWGSCGAVIVELLVCSTGC